VLTRLSPFLRLKGVPFSFFMLHAKLSCSRLASNPSAHRAHTEPLRLPPFTLFAPEGNQSSALALEPTYLRFSAAFGSMWQDTQD
jgi:hypothetical protein